MHIISATDFPIFCSNFARKCHFLPAECSLQKSLILLEILPAEFTQAYQLHNFVRLAAVGALILPERFCVFTRLNQSPIAFCPRLASFRRGEIIKLSQLQYNCSFGVFLFAAKRVSVIFLKAITVQQQALILTQPRDRSTSLICS